MVREKRKIPAAVDGGPKERHKRALRPHHGPLSHPPEGLVAKPAVPKSRHHTYLEFVENKDKKKKLEFQVTNQTTAPPGFEFVPIGNPGLTTACKELSRERDAMIFIVSNKKDTSTNAFASQMFRTGHHFRQAIVEEARLTNVASHDDAASHAACNGAPEPIPKSQREYLAQADAALRDSFPRIPNTDREMIIERAFIQHANGGGRHPNPVGLSADLSLARRVQLAVLAHIRHTHTRYDELLQETSWRNARKVVEPLCLDILVKWRGDEETGRDQLDEILREVVVISDSEGDESEEDDEIRDAAMQLDKSTGDIPIPISHPNNVIQLVGVDESCPPEPGPISGGVLLSSGSKDNPKEIDRSRTNDKKGQRGFKRYRAWEEAIQRNRGQDVQSGNLVERSELPRLAIGAAPSLNGYVPQRHSVHVSEPLPPPPPYRGPIAPVQLTSGIVNASLHRRTPPGPEFRQTPSPVTNHFQDLLVRSIEPTSPESLQPSFVRPVPPREPRQAYVAPSHPTLQRFSRPSPRRDVPMVDAQTYHSRPVINDPPRAQGAPMHVGTATQSATNGAMLYDSGRALLPNRERIIVNATRPGERSNPILMEDRGGFFERVPHQSESQPVLPPSLGIIEIRRGDIAPPQFNAPRRMIHREEGPHDLDEGRRAPGMETIPISRPPQRQHDVAPSQQYPERWQYEGASSETLPPHHPDHAYRQGRNDRPVVYMGYNDARPNRRSRPQPHHPEDVIVIE